LRGASWPALDPAERTATAPTIDPAASMEVLARETTIDDSDLSSSSADHYFRIKVFNKAGVDRLAKIEIPFDRSSGSVTGIEARTIKPDGTIVELKKSDVFERDVMKVGDVRRRVKSFAPPGLEPGAIVEYRYRTNSETRVPMFPLLFQADSPARSVKYRFKPIGVVPGLSMQVLYLNYPVKEIKPERDGFYQFTATNLPAFKEEPMSGPAVHLASSVVLYYTFEPAKSPDRYWASLSEKLFGETKSKAKATKAIVAEAQRLVAPTDSDEEKLRKLHDYCRTKIQNRSSDASGLTREQRRKLKANDDADDTLKNASGSRDEINALFVALARGLGLDARLALANDRTLFIFVPKLPVPFAFNRRVGAVRVDGQWRFYDPGALYLPPGMIDWRYCDTSILIANEKGALIEPVAGAPAERSFRHQVATLTLNDDGALEGDVTLSYTGYFEATEKNALDAASTDKIEKHLLAALEPHLKGAEISEVKIVGAAKPLEPLQVRFHLRVPEFAERTGSRLFIQPNIFRRGVKALFEAPTRKTTIIFPHRYRETDEISLVLPEGAVIEAGSAPAGLDLGAIGSYDVGISWSAKNRTVRLRRDFSFNVLGYNAEKYATVKRIYEIMQERDDHTLTFRVGGEAGSADANASEPLKTP
jgi:transglutaminase-like putative cysteine protease